MIRSVFRASALTVSIIGSSLVQADGITGRILFSYFDWSDNGTTVSVDNPMVVLGEGSFSEESIVQYADLDYSPFSIPMEPLWQTDSFEFFITSVTMMSHSASGLELEGQGRVSDKDGVLEDTSANWFFSGGSINWSSATEVNVDEPANMALLGIGLCALAFSRRRFVLSMR